MLVIGSCSLKVQVYATKGPLVRTPLSLSLNVYNQKSKPFAFLYTCLLFLCTFTNAVCTHVCAAALRVLSHLPLPYSAFSTLTVVPTPLRDAVYDYVAKRHYDWFGKDEDCLVLKEEELLDRFIDREEIMAKIQSNMW